MTKDEVCAAIELATHAKMRADRATEGPWDGGKGDVSCNVGDCCIVDSDCGWHGVMREEDGEFIGHARTDVPALADTVVRLVERVRELEHEDDAHHQLLVRQHERTQALQQHLLGGVDYWEDVGKLATRALDRIKELEEALRPFAIARPRGSTCDRAFCEAHYDRAIRVLRKEPKP